MVLYPSFGFLGFEDCASSFRGLLPVDFFLSFIFEMVSSRRRIILRIKSVETSSWKAAREDAFTYELHHGIGSTIKSRLHSTFFAVSSSFGELLRFKLDRCKKIPIQRARIE